MKNRSVFISILFVFIAISLFAKDKQIQLTESQRKICQSVTTVKITVTQDYGESGPGNLPFKQKAKEFLSRYTNLSIVTEDSIPCDAVLNIQVVGSALSNKYGASHFSPSGQIEYSGAKFEGDFTYTISQTPYYKGSIIGTFNPPPEIHQHYPHPKDAPFKKAFQKLTLESELIKMIGIIYGIEPVTLALEDPEESVRLAAVQTCIILNDQKAVEPLIFALENKLTYTGNIIRALGALKDNRAVPVLCAFLSDAPVDAAEALGNINDRRGIKPMIDQLKITENKWMKKQIAKALKKMTGENFGTKNEKWITWWEEHNNPNQ